MPRRQESRKDVANNEKPRGAVSKLRSVDIRMGKPGREEPYHLLLNKIGRLKTTGRTETSKYPEEEKETSISLVAASEMERAQTAFGRGNGPQKLRMRLDELLGKADRRA